MLDAIFRIAPLAVPSADAMPDACPLAVVSDAPKDLVAPAATMTKAPNAAIAPRTVEKQEVTPADVPIRPTKELIALDVKLDTAAVS